MEGSGGKRGKENEKGIKTGMGKRVEKNGRIERERERERWG